MNACLNIFEAFWRAAKSAGRPAHSGTLARWPYTRSFAKRLGVRRPSAAWVVVIIFFTTWFGAHADDFASGTAAAQAGNFSDAKKLFEGDIRARPSVGACLNLGNVEWQSGHAGAAVLAWERAAWINPFDERAADNLKFARLAAQLDEPDLRWHETISTWLPPNLWVWLAGAGLWLALGALVLPRVLRWRKAGWQQTLAALGCCVFIFAMAGNVGVVSRTNLGFVVKKNVMLRLTPTSGSELISAVPAGEPLRKVKTRGNFIYVRTPMAAGWLERGEVGWVNDQSKRP